MFQSEFINELATALSKAQGEMQAAIKDKINPFYKTSYADLGSIWDAARPVLCKYGLCVMQTTELNSERNQIIMVTTLAHNSGQWVKSYLPLNPSKNDSQGIGAAITYLRRYSLSALVGVVCDDDDDGETAAGRGKCAKNLSLPNANESSSKFAESLKNDEEKIKKAGNFPQQERIGKPEIVALTNIISVLDQESSKSFYDQIKKIFNAEALQDIPKNGFDRCLNFLNAKLKYVKDQERAIA